MPAQERPLLQTSTSRALITSGILSVFALGALFYLNQEIINGGADFEVQGDQADVEVETDSAHDSVPQAILNAIEELEKDEDREWSPKVIILSEILQSRNDNDPRLDSELRDLTPEERRELREFYRTLEWEDRNGRGTTVFLLGRNIDSEEDLDFFVEVLSEAPCLSLRDCETAEAEFLPSVDDHDATKEITLAYPQVVALKSLEREFGQESRLREMFMETLTVAVDNRNPRVSTMAQNILASWTD